MIAREQHGRARLARLGQRLRIARVGRGKDITRLTLGEALREAAGFAEHRLDRGPVGSRLRLGDRRQCGPQAAGSIKANHGDLRCRQTRCQHCSAHAQARDCVIAAGAAGAAGAAR